MAHDPDKQILALARLITDYAAKHHDAAITADIAARAVLSQFDLAGKGTLTAFKDWVLEMQAAGPYLNEGGGSGQAQNCAAAICC